MWNLLKYSYNGFKACGFGGGALARQQAVLLLILFFLAAVRLSGAEEGGPESVNPHDYSNKKYCHICHKIEMPGLNFDPVTTCTKCHSGNVEDHPVTRHPIGKVPKINIPSGLPLTRDGRIVCYTCHDPHKKTAYPKMLRVEYLKLCDSCHVGY